MSTQVTLQHAQAARDSHDPQAVDLLLEVIQSPVDPTENPPQEGAYDFANFLSEINRRSFYKQSSEEQAQQRTEKLKLVEANEDLAPRYQSHQMIYDLWQSGDAFDRRLLLDLIRRCPLMYGPWKALKTIFKEAEAAGDSEVMGALSARFDTAFSTGHHEVSTRTLGYLCRRSWRYLRRIAESLPACYADTVVDFLAPYTNHDHLHNSWVYNQIFLHDSKLKRRTRFQATYTIRNSDFLKTRAFPELWKRSPLPLFSLLQHSDRGDVLKYAVSALKADFRSVIREIEPRWVRQLINHRKSVVHDFVVWILENVSAFEQSRFVELELHDSVLQLLDSPSAGAREFAAKYARVGGRDMPVADLIRHANNADPKVRSLANDLLRSRDPRTEIGLEAWGELLDTEHGNKLAAETLHKHFTAKDLTPEWFKERLLSGRQQSCAFAQKNLLEVHSLKKLGSEYLLDIYHDADPHHNHAVFSFVFDQLEKTDLKNIPIASLEQMLICHCPWISTWVLRGFLSPNQFSPEFLKGIAYHPTFDQRPEVKAARESKHAKLAFYNEHTVVEIFSWLSDIRQFTPDQIGFEWLMELVQRDEPRYHDFATDLMIKSYLPADFAPQQESAAEPTSDGDDEINIDFEGASFVFTGKLATMTRAEAQKKVAAANGKKAGTVGKTLGYLVIGDEGSPMYGMGRKGSKQVKAEGLNEAGASIRIISETAFLQMLTGTQREFSDDAVAEGCQSLWNMMLDNKEGTPLSRFAIKYVRQHHPEICLAETDRPVDPGSEIPDSFLNFDNLKLLLADHCQSLRTLGLELCQYEFARIAPPANELLELSELPDHEVREFVAKSMTVEPAVANRKWRLDPDQFSAEDVYGFCQSKNQEVRALGMQLIEAHPRLREPEKLFALTESPDRNVRAFVIRAFWSLYRDRGIKRDWKPNDVVVSELKKKPADPQEPRFGHGAAPRPEQRPAAEERMQFLLRQMLFEISPGRPPIEKGDAIESLKIKPLPTRKAKLLLVETLRDMAIEDHEFASVVLPVLEEFQQSVGKSEHAACLVAVTRIRKSIGRQAVREKEKAGAGS